MTEGGRLSIDIDYFCGIQIKKELISGEYAVKSLWKINLDKSWRLVYTIAQDEIVIYSIILEWFNHKEYERRFKF